MNITYSISNWIYGEELLEKHFDRLKRHGYDAIELMIEDPATINISAVKALMKEHEMPVCSICTMMTGAAPKDSRRNLIDPDPAVRRQTMEYLKACLTIGQDVGARLVLSVPSGVANVSDGWTPGNQDTCVAAMQELGDHAKATGAIRFAIEPINRYENAFLQRADQAKQLLEKVNHPSIKMMLDFFHTNIDEPSNGDAIRLAGKDLIHCHVADSNRMSTGRGHTDWFEIMRALRDVDFHGALACEPLPPTGADVYESRKGVRPEADLYAEECISYLKFIERIVRGD